MTKTKGELKFGDHVVVSYSVLGDFVRKNSVGVVIESETCGGKCLVMFNDPMRRDRCIRVWLNREHLAPTTPRPLVYDDLVAWVTSETNCYTLCKVVGLPDPPGSGRFTVRFCEEEGRHSYEVAEEVLKLLPRINTSEEELEVKVEHKIGDTVKVLRSSVGSDVKVGDVGVVIQSVKETKTSDVTVMFEHKDTVVRLLQSEVVKVKSRKPRKGDTVVILARPGFGERAVVNDIEEGTMDGDIAWITRSGLHLPYECQVDKVRLLPKREERPGIKAKGACKELGRGCSTTDVHFGQQGACLRRQRCLWYRYGSQSGSGALHRSQ